ncbi:MAG: phosphatidate cytidylyltransferase [Puniceicoccales bacterium]|jgi:phosphatidate cytidylyltransferase|nr:phosphatidate cytidylyltransferase [Puniceicoccales bacterium]
MKERILSTIILCVLLVLTLTKMGILGGILFLALCSASAQWELYQLMEKMGWKPHKKSATALGMFILLGSFFSKEGFFDFNYTLSMLTSTVVVFAFSLVSTGKPEDLKNVFLPTIFGIFYVPIMFSIPISLIPKFSLLLESNLPLLLILWVIAVTKFSDIGGLLVGYRFGKHKLAPAFSPKKTYEGLLGSIVFSVAIGYIFAFCCGNTWPENFTNGKIGIVSAIIAIIALISDLVESGFKRLAGEKDSGHTIPGIGGTLDLMDSLILALPMGIIIIKEYILV